MKIVVSTTNGGLEDSVCPVFGRCQRHTVIECSENEIKDTYVEDNPGFAAGGGAGIRAAQFIIDKQVDAVISGNFGPNAAAVLTQAGVKMILYQGLVKDAVEKYLDGKLNSVDAPTVDDHFGRGRHGFGGRRGQTSWR
ncbi:MAG: dinitrogenase iron-molybdenum cofactor [Candidatus Altiarchaeales archaeon]|nr:dinitrogenase iron-molybdenum cofactor [Candidatus Altiarchaeales archaeon]